MEKIDESIYEIESESEDEIKDDTKDERLKRWEARGIDYYKNEYVDATLRNFKISNKNNQGDSKFICKLNQGRGHSLGKWDQYSDLPSKLKRLKELNL